ncbi:MAG: Na+/H+ antiporter subunit B [Armatimonadota bacterium]|nr:Na+/H+ antiporter subunit B [Armatimonadota bacterium]MDR7401104.1 Na+/H+ antiporter subunit B [Armatimonadota bacterium]MDR7403544.1 Na+/H+ antiporter subunit B [Armatimonadota bacterium]MDR7436399.1 Na+/H+ antiporter subunit B [Armatimonadota bacterium]MDR7471756.1 Na+/H+ antiporter subunit B [Armatimonadota bacterium]
MTSLILSTAARFLLPLLLLFSLFLLATGHHEPGGGFVGGLVAAGAFTLYAIAYGVPATRMLLRVDSRLPVGVGLLIILASGAVALLRGQPLLTGQWWDFPLHAAARVTVGTPLIFDVGVYLLVVGTVLTIFMSLAEE